MGVLLYKYCSDKSNEVTIKAASDAWHQKNTQALRPAGASIDNGRTPMQAVANMVDKYWIQLDQIDDELDWHYFQIESADSTPVPQVETESSPSQE